MAKRVLDTVILIKHWWDCWKASKQSPTTEDAERWGRSLIQLRRADLIVSPVYIEFVAGVTKGNELPLARSYLSVFKVLDGWNLVPADLVEALRRAERIPANSSRRQLGDCLIRAVSKRFRCDVVTIDKSFAR